MIEFRVFYYTTFPSKEYLHPTYRLDNLIIEFKPSVSFSNKYVVVAWSTFLSTMNQHSIQGVLKLKMQQHKNDWECICMSFYSMNYLRWAFGFGFKRIINKILHINLRRIFVFIQNLHHLHLKCVVLNTSNRWLCGEK